MRELIGKECRAVFNLPHNEWPIEGYPAWVIVDAVDMPMVKMRSRFSGSPLWVNAATLKTIQVVKETAVDPLWVRLLRRWSGDSQPMKKFQGSSLYLTPEGLRDQTGEIILTKREILDELVGPGAEAPLPEGREQGWISFKERKPRSGGVLAVDDEGEIDLYQWNLAVEYSKEGQEHRLSHWMPLPNPPSPQDDSRSKA